MSADEKPVAVRQTELIRMVAKADVEIAAWSAHRLTVLTELQAVANWSDEDLAAFLANEPPIATD